jgi:pimeloyl-ACP methyl ester carboxylesterase
MPKVESNGITIEYDSFGRAEDPPLVLIMGLGCQMIYWHEDFCDALAARGFRVVRFDNRDIGLSTKLDHLGMPPVVRLLLRGGVGLRASAPYGLHDMADDTLGLLDALGIERAHVVGVSMGGMIAQLLAIRAPERLLSLCSWSSTTGARWCSTPTPRALRALLSRPTPGRHGRVEHAVRLMQVVGSGHLVDETWLRDRVALAYDRSSYWAGFVRQFAAVVTARPRTRALAGVRAPTVVLHGSADSLILPAGGRATASAIPGARLEIIEGMGHDVPRALWPRLIAAIADNAARA